jgi:eukaryotic-like serine/threonine-protein kinase
VLEEGGHFIADRYRLMKQLGKGGMGSIWLAQDTNLGSPVAIKLIDPALAADEDARARFRHEAKAAAALRSPHIVQILDHGLGQAPFIAMELLEGESLAQRLERVRVLPHAETERILSDVARGVRRAHEAGIIHRDLKPDNVFLVHNGDREIAKVLDFGIAKSTGSVGGPRAATQTGSMIGTLPYMSPEQAQGAKTIDFRSDLWALAVIAFECVCGRLPFESEHAGEIVLQICARPIPVPSQVAAVPPGFDAWFAKASARDPDARFQSAQELAEALRRVLNPARAPEPEAPSVRAADLAERPIAAVATLNGGATIDRGPTVVRGAARAEARSSRAPLAWGMGGVAIAIACGLAFVFLHAAPAAGPAPVAGAASQIAATAGPEVAPPPARPKDTAPAESTAAAAPPPATTPAATAPPATALPATAPPATAPPATGAPASTPVRVALPVKPSAGPTATPAPTTGPATGPKKKDRLGF